MADLYRPQNVLKEPKGYEAVQVAIPCSQQRIGTLGRLGVKPESIRNADGSISEGNWYWWTSKECPGPNDDLADAARIDLGLEPCARDHVPGRTCVRKFYPERTLYPDGSFREQGWSWNAQAGNRDEMGFTQNWNIYFTPEEAAIYATLRDDNYLKSLDVQTALAIYYGVLNWRCVGKLNAILEPSPVSPQSLAGRHDSGSQFWLEFWERSIRDRIWMVRSDLRQVRLPDGKLVTGLRPPNEISRPPSCVTEAGQIAGYVAGALALYAGAPGWLTTVMSLPNTLLGFRDMLRQLNLASKIQESLLGEPSPAEKELLDKSSQTKSPTGFAGGASGFPWWLVAGAALLLSS